MEQCFSISDFFILFYLCSVRFAFSPLSEEEEEDEQKEPMLKESFGSDKIHLLFVLNSFLVFRNRVNEV